MKYSKYFAVLLIFTLLFATPTLALHTNQPLRSKKKRSDGTNSKILQFSREFSQKLSKSRDIRPLIEAYFVPAFKNHIKEMLFVENRSSMITRPHRWAFTSFPPEMLNEISDEDLFDYYVESINILYLLVHYQLSYALHQNPNRDLNTLPSLNESLPDDIRTILEEDPHFKGLIGISDLASAIDSNKPIQNLVEFQNFLTSLKTVTTLLRQQNIDMALEQNPKFKKASQELYVAQNFVISDLCENDCGDLPDHTRFYQLLGGLFLHLHVVEIDGNLKIYFIDLPID